MTPENGSKIIIIAFHRSPIVLSVQFANKNKKYNHQNITLQLSGLLVIIIK